MSFFAASRRRPFSPDTAAFVSLKLGAACCIIGMVAAIATPLLKTATRERRTAAAVTDLKAFATAFQAFAHDHGDWPAGPAAPGQIPEGMQPRLASTRWSESTPIGGRYMWAAGTLHQGERYHAAILLTNVPDEAVADDRLQLEEIDRQLDDGVLATGRFRLGFRNQPVYVLEH